MANPIHDPFNDNWPKRRGVLFISLAYIGATVEYIVMMGKDSAINSQVCVALIASGTALLTAYIFGAVWDDNNKRMFFKNQPIPRDAQGDPAPPPIGAPEVPNGGTPEAPDTCKDDH